MGHTSLHFCSSSRAPQFGQVRSICSTLEGLQVAVVMGFVVLLLFSKIFCKVAQDRGRVCGPAFESGDASGTAPAGTPFNTNDDVFIKESALLQKSYCGFRSEFVRAELTHTDQIAQALRLLRFRQFQKGVQAVYLAFCRGLPVL